MEREFEAKGLITKQDFTKLLNDLTVSETKHQTNTYVDTREEFFKSKNSALRLRIINDEYIFSLKQKDNDGATEWNCKLTEDEYNNICSTKQIDLSKYDCPYNNTLTDLNIITITTNRYVLNYNNFIIELDETNFGNISDYEIEIESSSLKIANNTLQELATIYQLTINNSKPKIARYFDYNNYQQ